MLGVVGVMAPREAPHQHPTRRRILDYLLAIPGDHFRSIARNLGLSIGEARHHLDALIRAGLVTERKEHSRSRYYPRNRNSDADRNELFSRHWAYRDLRMRILIKLRADGSGSASQVAERVGISRQLAAYHLDRLMELGLVHREGRRYRPNAMPRPDWKGEPNPPR